ncbi:MAG: hypothetical protein ACI8RD_009081, partial [Bacillariaceae sp.]
SDSFGFILFFDSGVLLLLRFIVVCIASFVFDHGILLFAKRTAAASSQLLLFQFLFPVCELS